MSIEKWVPIQKALAEKFSGGKDNVIGGKWLGPVLNEEREYGAWLIRTFRGFDETDAAFFDFYIETLHLAAEGAFHGQLPKTDRHYAVLYAVYLNLFRGLRAASTLKDNGYPMRGFAALRDQKDRAIHIGAVNNGMTNILAIYGIDQPQEQAGHMGEEEYKKVQKRRSKEQSRVTSLMVGKNSGLAPEDIAEMERLRDLYHEEVHGGMLTFLEDFRTIFVDKELPAIGPRPHRKNMDAASYMNRASEVGWMTLRSLPFLQLKPRAFGDDWADRWTLLDTAFRMQNEGLAEDGKPIGLIFSRMVDARFAFDPDCHYRVNA